MDTRAGSPKFRTVTATTDLARDANVQWRGQFLETTVRDSDDNRVKALLIRRQGYIYKMRASDRPDLQEIKPLSQMSSWACLPATPDSGLFLLTFVASTRHADYAISINSTSKISVADGGMIGGIPSGP